MKPLRILSDAARALSAALLLAMASPAQAFDVNPVVSVIEIPGKAAGITVTLRNPRTSDLPVEFEIVERSVAEDGTETTRLADDDFTIFPPQAIVAAGKTQAIRVQWLGPAPTTSRSFTLYAAEQPVDLTGATETTVQTVFRIGASIHVVGRDARPVPTLIAAAAEGDGVKVTLGNDGPRYYYIDELSLAFADKTVAGIDLGNIATRTLVPPGARRSFIVPGVTGTPKLTVVGR